MEEEDFESAQEDFESDVEDFESDVEEDLESDESSKRRRRVQGSSPLQRDQSSRQNIPRKPEKLKSAVEEDDLKSTQEENMESSSSTSSIDEALKRRSEVQGFSGHNKSLPSPSLLRPPSDSQLGASVAYYPGMPYPRDAYYYYWPSPPSLPPRTSPPPPPSPPRNDAGYNLEYFFPTRDEEYNWEYHFPTRVNDVFLSFRGEDTRTTFISHLYSSLTNAGIEVFKDDETLPKGDQINSLLKAIENSKISIIVFSRKYANSRWCLLELEKIMDCHSTNGQVVLPVFVGIDPSEVRHQSGSFGESFGDLIRRASEKGDQILKWKASLHQAASIAGFTLINSRNESKDIENIVEHVCNMLDKRNLFVADHPVGVESRVQDVIQLLSNQHSSNDVPLVGLWGMGGIGKTTIAKAIYNEIGRDFEGRSFLVNIREVWEQDKINGPISLQQRILYDVFKTTKMKIHSIESGISLMKEKLRHKRILLILDDVNNLDQLKTLLGGHEWFHPGSRILVTTRDQHMLKVLKVDYVYKMKEMDESESFELFSWHAFKQATLKEDFVELSRNVIAYSGGLPLALQVLGSLLFAREKSEWKGVLEKLKIIPNDQIQKKLKISFDSLDYLDQDIFLDISCFFIGMDRYVTTQILNECGFCADIGIATLIERSLVTIDKNKLGMHGLLRDMGREIIREKAPDMVGERTRLWFHDNVRDVLSKCTGTNFVEGLSLMLPRTNTISLRTKAFEKMERLRLLQLGHVQLEGDYKYLSKTLKWLCWHGFPLKNTPSKFDQGSLVAIDLKYSNLKIVWKNPQLLEKLKILNLSHSHYLTQTPNFTNLPNLEWLVLKDCTRLSKVHHTIGQLDKLTLLNLKDCKMLPNLPRSIYKLTSLTTLILSGCSNIDKLEEDLEQMKSLTTLVADKTAIRKVPFSIIRSNIGYISLCGYEGSSRDVFPSLIWSWMSPKTNLSLIQPFESLQSVVSLNLPNSSFNGLSSILNEVPNLQSLCLECGSNTQLSEELERILDTLYAANSTQLTALPSTSEMSASGMETEAIIDSINETGISPVSEYALRCRLIQMGRNNQITSLKESILENFRSCGSNHDFCLPGDKLPVWLTFIGEGASVFFTVPQDTGYNLRTMALCLLYLSSEGNITCGHINNVLIINYTMATIQLYKRDSITSFEEVDCESYISNLEAGDEVEVMVVCGYGLTLKKTAVYLFYGSSNQETVMEISHDPNHQDHFSLDINGCEEVHRNSDRDKSMSRISKIFQKRSRK